MFLWWYFYKFITKSSNGWHGNLAGFPGAPTVPETPFKPGLPSGPFGPGAASHLNK